MASPYALDFSPISEAIDSNQRNELFRNKLAMEQKRLGFEEEMQPFKIKQAQQEVDRGAAELQKARFARGADFFDTQINVEGITPEEKAARWNKFLQSPIFKDDTELAHPAYGALWRDPVTGPAMFGNLISGYRLDKKAKEVGIAGKEAEAKKDTAQAGLFTSQAEQGKFIPLNENAQGVFDVRAKQVIPVTQGLNGERIFGKGFAKDQAPKLFVESSKLYADAADTHNIMGALEELAPYAKTGFGGPQLLQLRKLGTQFGIKNESIAPTELFQFLAQKGVFELTKQLKPASNLDMVASERATASLQSDPSTLGVALPVLKRIAERSMLRHKLEMDAYKRGEPPDSPSIMEKINKDMPLDLSAVSQQSGPVAGPRVQKQFGDRAPGAQVPPGAVRMLQQNANNPDVVRQFEEKYGAGSAAQFMQQR